MSNNLPARNNQTAIVPVMPTGMRKVEPDDDRYVNKFHVNSASSDRVYRISYDRSPGAGWWICSCRGCIAHGHCKHLESIGLRPTRRDIMQRRIADGQAQPNSKPSTVNRPGPRRLGRGRR